MDLVRRRIKTLGVNETARFFKKTGLIFKDTKDLKRTIMSRMKDVVNVGPTDTQTVAQWLYPPK
ncbi:MAG: hypothetical protein JKY34_09405 [Kordiimonadaceae bacterium]|nr:hypothetical protein [Kordiimonadaceae bacterium]